MSTMIDLAKAELSERLKVLENEFQADVISYTGGFYEGIENNFKKIIEDLKKESKNKTIFIVLTSDGGSAQVVERCVSILRYHYEEVNFIIPNYAYSAGTIFCMSGDHILMDYFSVLGPIDPQVKNKDGRYVPALGYLDKVGEMLKKSQTGELTQPEFLILKDFDLAELRSYEQARELSISLLEKWLVKYKFKNWKVTAKEKIERAQEIAIALSDNNKWKTHARPINIEDLKELKLKIEDYSQDPLKGMIDKYYDLLISFLEFVKHQGVFIHTRNYS